jgi:hypothetical protein
LSSHLQFKNVKIKIYKIILLSVLYGCETWSLMFREEHRLRVSENRVLRRLFGPKRGEVTGGWRKFQNDEVKEDEMGRAGSVCGGNEKCMQNFGWKA